MYNSCLISSSLLSSCPLIPCLLLLSSFVLCSPLGWCRGAAHVVSSGLDYAGLTVGSLINGWSQRGQTQELRGSCTQQHPADNTASLPILQHVYGFKHSARHFSVLFVVNAFKTPTSLGLIRKM